MDTSASNAPLRKRGRPRRVLFEEPQTPNNMENEIRPPRPQEPIPPVQNEPLHVPATDQLLNLLRQALNQGPQQRVPNRERDNDAEDKQFTRFLGFNPPKFKGEPDDQKAEFWLLEIEKIFKRLKYPDHQKVEYATFLLEEAASQWWRVVERKWEREEAEGTWEEFR